VSDDRNPAPPGSRYHGVPVATLESPDGTTRLYLRRRFIAPAASFALLSEHMVGEGDRVDRLAARYLGDSTQYWRICDANGVQRPDELTAAPGRRIRITLPSGIPGTPDDL
jgi:hypothetical protein